MHMWNCNELHGDTQMHEIVYMHMHCALTHSNRYTLAFTTYRYTELESWSDIHTKWCYLCGSSSHIHSHVVCMHLLYSPLPLQEQGPRVALDRYCEGTLMKNHSMIILMTHAMYYPQSQYLILDYLPITKQSLTLLKPRLWSQSSS